MTAAVVDEPAEITSPSDKSVSGFSAPRTVPTGGFDLSTIRSDPPLFVKRMTISVVVRPVDVPISI